MTLGGRERTVVGVVGNIRVRGLERESEPQVYLPAAQGQAYPGDFPRELVVLSSFAAIAVLLAAIGVHGLLWFAVSSRARDIGVRMALGASRASIVRMVVAHAALLAIAGLALGSALAVAAGSAMRALLAGVSPMDPLTFAGALLLATVMTLSGTVLPTLRAVRVDPITVIRTE